MTSDDSLLVERLRRHPNGIDEAIERADEAATRIIALSRALQKATSEGWLPIALYPDDNSIVLVANPDEGTLPVIAWKVEDTWYQYDLQRTRLIPTPTIWMKWPKMPRSSPLSSKECK